MKCYKVVSETGNGYFSFLVRRNLALRLEYDIGKKTTASIGGVLCFPRLRDALNFLCVDLGHMRNLYPILVCDGEQPVPLPRYRLDRRCTVRRAKMCWRDVLYSTWELYEWPEATVAYKSVTPVAVVSEGTIKAALKRMHR